jgi:bacterioferritin-associated ferredoxin
MQADDELCLCFHISCRKVLNYIRIHRVRLPSQLSECGGAGTGCGWCRKQMQKLLVQCQESPPAAEEIEAWLAARTPQKSVYGEGREKYRAAKGGQDVAAEGLREGEALGGSEIGGSERIVPNDVGEKQGS